MLHINGTKVIGPLVSENMFKDCLHIHKVGMENILVLSPELNSNGSLMKSTSIDPIVSEKNIFEDCDGCQICATLIEDQMPTLTWNLSTVKHVVSGHS